MATRRLGHKVRVQALPGIGTCNPFARHNPIPIAGKPPGSLILSREGDPFGPRVVCSVCDEVRDDVCWERIPGVSYLVPACAACSPRRRATLPTPWERILGDD